MTASDATRLPHVSRRNRPRRAQRLVLAWCGRYTRGLPVAVAEGRRDELASDLWEQEAASRGGGLGASILWRAARGVAADLSWRRSRIRALPPSERPERWWRWTASGSVVAAAVLAAVLVAFGGFALVHVLLAVARHDFLPREVTIISTAIGTVGMVCGLAMLARARTRWVGALWIAAFSAPLLWFGTVTLITLSSTVQGLFFRWEAYGPAWRSPANLASWGGLALVVLFFTSLAVAWLPTRRTESSR